MALYPCGSTHGGAGYAPGSYWKEGKIICGACGAAIENPRPTGSRWILEKGWRGWLLRRGRWVPTWPRFVIPEGGWPPIPRPIMDPPGGWPPRETSRPPPPKEDA